MSGSRAGRHSGQGPVTARAKLRPKSQLTLPEDIRRALHVSEGDEVEFRVEQGGTITVRGYVSVPTEHAWLYATPPSAREAASREVAAERASTHDSVDALFMHLDALGAADALCPRSRRPPPSRGDGAP